MRKSFNLPFELGRIKCRLLGISTNNEKRLEKMYYQHNHSCYELHYATQGCYTLLLGSTQYHILAGQIILIPPGVYHQIWDMSADLEKVDLTFELVPPASLREDTEEAHLLHVFSQYNRFDIDDGQPLNNLWQTLKQICLLAEHYDEAPYLCREKLRAQATLLLLDLYAKLSVNAPAMPATFLASDALTTTIDEFFSFNYDNSESINDLAEQLHVGVRQLNRILQKRYGMSYREKLNEVRLEVATNFLTTTTKSIAEISGLLGYNNPANFSTFIKSETGKTPTQIRSQSRLT